MLAWVTVGARGRELGLAQAIVEAPVAVGEGVPSKAPAAEAVMRVAPAPAVPQAVAGEVVVPAAAVAAVEGVVVVVVVVVVTRWRAPVKGVVIYLRSFGCSRGGKEDALCDRKLGKSLDE